MRIIVDVGHPAQVHFHRNSIKKLEDDGHEVLVSARDKDVLIDLLNKYNLNYKIISKQKYGIIGLGTELVERCLNLRKIIKEFHPDLIYGAGETVSIVGKLERIPTIIFNDSEPVSLNKILTYPWTNTICTPLTFTKSLGKKQFIYKGYKELAYLHPSYFTPDDSIYSELNLDFNQRFVVIRFVSWNAAHDIGEKGLSLDQKIKIVKHLEKYATVFISSEGQLSPELEKYKLPLKSDQIHNALYYADLFFGDSQTMTTEAAVLGTPAIRCNSFVGDNDMGNFIELENKYGLIFNYRNSDEALDKAIDLLQDKNIKNEWKVKKEQFLLEQIDVTKFIVWLVENYPQSLKHGIFDKNSEKELL